MYNHTQYGYATVIETYKSSQPTHAPDKTEQAERLKSRERRLGLTNISTSFLAYPHLSHYIHIFLNISTSLIIISTSFQAYPHL